MVISGDLGYPGYLHEPCCRIASPGQSLQALTVGSVAYGTFNQGGWQSIAAGTDHASAFSRCGFGVWDAIKPEVVEYGGDNLLNTGHNLTVVGTPPAAATCYPDLVASTMHGRTSAHGRDGTVGTSFAAPKVSRIAAELQAVLPAESCLLYRAMIVQSARWPAWARDLPAAEQLNVLRLIGDSFSSRWRQLLLRFDHPPIGTRQDVVSVAVFARRFLACSAR